MRQGRAAAGIGLLLLLAGCGGSEDPFGHFADHVATRHQPAPARGDSATVDGPASGWQASIRPDPESGEVAVSIGCPAASFVLISWLADDRAENGSEWRSCGTSLVWVTRPPAAVTFTITTSPALEPGQQLRVAVRSGTVTAAAAL